MRATVILLVKGHDIGYIHKIGNRIRGAKVNTSKGEITRMGSSALPGGWSFQGLSGVRTTAKHEMFGEIYDDLLAV